MENDIFYALVQEKKQERHKIGRKIFPLDLPFFILPIWEENGKEKMLNDVLYTNTLTLFISPTPHFIHLTCDLINIFPRNNCWINGFFIYFILNECRFADHVFAADVFIAQLPS